MSGGKENELTDGDGRADNRGDGCIECMLRAGELKRVEGGSDGRHICSDGNVPVANVLAPSPDHVALYGEYRCFFGDSASACARCCIINGWFGHVLR